MKILKALEEKKGISFKERVRLLLQNYSLYRLYLKLNKKQNIFKRKKRNENISPSVDIKNRTKVLNFCLLFGYGSDAIGSDWFGLCEEHDSLWLIAI